MSQIKSCSSEVKTSFLKRSYLFRWSIENFPKYLETFKLSSHEFKPIKNKSVARIFSVTLEKETGDDLNFTVNSVPEETNDHRFAINCKITITDITGKKFESRTYRKSYGKGFNNSFSLQFSNKKLIEYNDSIENKTLIFDCLMEFAEITNTVHHDQLILSTSPDVELDLLDDFKTMCLDSTHADLKLLVQGDVIQCHKCVLSARSPVLAKLLVSPMEEVSTDVIKIDDIEFRIVKHFINFLYTGLLDEELNFEDLCGLYYAADKYDVPSLRKACSNILLYRMEAENACRILALANRHSDDKLKDLVMNYVNFHFEVVLGSESLAECVKNDPELAIEVLKLRSKKIK